MAVGQYVTLAGLKARLGITDSVDDALLQTFVDGVNDWVERYCRRAIAPLPATQLTLDVEAESRVLLCPFGIRTLTTLEVARQTGGAYSTVPTTDWFLRPPAALRVAGAPATEIILSEQSGYRFWPGLDTVRLTGSFGWETVPADLAEAATTIAVRAWHGRQAGQTDIVGSDETGAPLVSRFVSLRDRQTLDSYRLWDLG